MKYIKLFENFLQDEKFTKVYRGGIYEGIDNSIWVTMYIDFATQYGKVKEYYMPNLNLLDCDDYSAWEELVSEFDEDIDYDEIKYEPSIEFKEFLKNKGYDGFINDENILILDKSLLYPIFKGDVDILFETIKKSRFNSLKDLTINDIVIDWNKYKNIDNDNIITIKYFTENPDILNEQVLIMNDNRLSDGYHRLIAMKILNLKNFSYINEIY